MKLALLGYPINHSLSPKLYKEILGSRLESYDLLPIKNPQMIPSLDELSKIFDGINITSPHKKHFINDILVDSPIVQKIGAVNTLALNGKIVKGTNTDVIAVEEILENYKSQYPSLLVIILGSGVMAKVTELVCQNLEIEFKSLSRKMGLDLSTIDISQFSKINYQTLVINCCSRDYVFKGKLAGDEIFWDYNYSFLPHQTDIPSQVKIYQDGQEMLRLQALAAVRFWELNKA